MVRILSAGLLGMAFVGMCSAQCRLSFAPVKNGDKEISGRYAPGAFERAPMFVVTPGPQPAEVLVDHALGTVVLRFGAPLTTAGVLHVNADGNCSADIEIPKPPTPKLGMNWLKSMPLRESTTTLQLDVEKDVKGVLALVFNPKIGARPDDAGPAQPTPGSKTAQRQGNEKAVLKKDLTHAVQASDLIGNLRADAYTSAGGVDERKTATPYLKAASRLDAYRNRDCVSGYVTQAAQVQVKDARADIVFREPLDEGQCVFVFPYGESSNEYFENAGISTIVESVERSYGRVNLIGLAGLAIGNPGTNTSQTSPYVAILIDGVAMNRFFHRDDNGVGDWGMSLNFFAEGRLSQAPVTGSPGTSLTAATSSLNIDNVQSQLLQAGLYLPVRFKGMAWEHDGSLHSFFIAPLIKYGAQWLKDGVKTRVTTTKNLPKEVVGTGEPIAVADTVSADTNTNAQPFYGGGFRVGFARYRFQQNRVSGRTARRENLGYFDLTYGHQHAFRTPFSYQALPAGESTGKLIDGTRLEPRLMVEGRIKVPGLPLFLGVEHSRNWTRPDAAAAELRFLAGIRLDILSIVGKSLNLKAKSAD